MFTFYGVLLIDWQRAMAEFEKFCELFDVIVKNSLDQKWNRTACDNSIPNLLITQVTF